MALPLLPHKNGSVLNRTLPVSHQSLPRAKGHKTMRNSVWWWTLALMLIVAAASKYTYILFSWNYWFSLYLLENSKNVYIPTYLSTLSFWIFMLWIFKFARQQKEFQKSFTLFFYTYPLISKMSSSLPFTGKKNCSNSYNHFQNWYRILELY